ncbi:transporter substrate-binding domain-containing protein [Pseudomonas sp. REB1044]|uniref:transporter substrate-binding domain-containing protein n=2 Tax=Pseudomonas sp. REB1044 TaxID=2675224 RepID=UPI00315D85EA
MWWRRRCTSPRARGPGRFPAVPQERRLADGTCQRQLPPQRPEDLCGKRIGSIKGGSWIPKLMALSKSHCEANGQSAIDSREFPTSPEAAQALLAKAVDVQFEDAAVAAITADKLKGRVLISSNELIYPVVIGLAVRKGNEALLSELRQGFADMKASGEYQTLLSRYNLAEPSAAEVAQALGQNPQAAAQ